MVLEILNDVSLQPHNSMAVAAQAHALTQVSSLLELEQALDYAQRNTLDVLVLGEGSNTLFENDYAGLVVLNRLLGLTILEQDEDGVVIKVAAGERWHEFVEYTVDQGWFGLENLALIPGLVGAAPMQNIGAYGVEVKDTIVSVDYLDMKTREIRTLTNQECLFAYRESLFKQLLAGKVVIVAVTFRLSKYANVNLSYPALANCFELMPTPRQVFDVVCQVRQTKLPLPSDIPNTGSFFKNPIITPSQRADLLRQYPDLVSYSFNGNFKLAAGWLIEKAGWKQRQKNSVKVHDKQALVLTNPGKRSGKEVLSFAFEIQQDIRKKFGVLLEIEPKIYR